MGYILKIGTKYYGGAGKFYTAKGKAVVISRDKINYWLAQYMLNLNITATRFTIQIIAVTSETSGNILPPTRKCNGIARVYK